jgi:hypothetical protein
MSQATPAANTGLKVKHRSVGAIVGLNLVTLRLYSIYWWYTINRELRDLGRQRGVDELDKKPALSALAYFTGPCLLIPYLWTAVTTSNRVHRAQRMIGVKPLEVSLPISLFVTSAVSCIALGVATGAGIALGLVALVIVSDLAAMVHLQVALNQAWEASGVPPQEPSQDVAPSTA